MQSVSIRKLIELERAQQAYAQRRKEHRLLQLFWECTLRCNLHCRHCGSDCKATAALPDMPFADFAKVLDTIAQHTDPHEVFVVITGGEPLMRPDLEQCGRAIYDKGYPWGMVTNGFALTAERLLRLRLAGMHSITVSLDGLHDSHDWMRGREGSFDRAANAIRLIAKTDLTYDVVTCVNKRNINQLPEMRKLLVEAGVKAWRIFTVFPMGRAANDPDMKLSGAEMRQVLDFIKDCRKPGRIDEIKVSYACEGFLGSYEGKVRDYFYTCHAGINVGSVLADGSISACSSIRANFHQGNIYRDDFWEVWNTRYQVYRDRSWMRKGECAECSWFRYCLGGGMHLRDDDGNLLLCHMKKLSE